MSEAMLDISPEEFTLENLFSSGFFGDTKSQSLFMDDEMGAPPEMVASGHSGRSDGRGVTKDDWEEAEESESFVRIKDAMRFACNINTKGTTRRKFVEWIFSPTKEDKDGITFDLCCSALESRGDLLRVRLQYQFFENHIIADPLPFLAHGIPQVMRSEIDYFCKPRCMELAQILWGNPGIRVDVIAERMSCSPSDLDPLITSIENLGYAGFWLGHGWFIGKNPLLMPRTERMRFKWVEVVL